MYRLFFSLDALLAAVQAAGAPLFIQTQRRTLTQHPIPIVETALVLSAPVPTPAVQPPGGPTLLAARLPIEQVQLWGLAGDQADHAALVRQVEAALALLTAHLTTLGIAYTVDGGIVAEAGLLEDLRHSPAGQDLWHLEGHDQTDPTKRRLVLGPR